MSTPVTRVLAPRRRLAVISEPGYAGVKRHVVDLLGALDLARFDVLFLYSLARADATYRAEIAALSARGVRCVETAMVREIRPRQDLQAALQLRRALAAFQPQVVHVHSSKAGFLGRLAARSVNLRVPTLYTPNLMACHDSRKYWWIEKAAVPFTSRIIAVSPSEQAQIRAWRLIAPERVVYAPMCLRPAGAYPVRWRPADAPPRVAACGRICRQKQAALFFRVAAAVGRTRPDVQFRWIGDEGTDAEAAEVRALRAADPHAARVEITGWVSDAEQQIADADVFCMFSRAESFGFVTADAMMMGVPVLATPAMGTVDLVRDGETGALVPADAGALAARLLGLLTAPDAPRRLAARARVEVAERFTVDRMRDALQALYDEVAA